MTRIFKVVLALAIASVATLGCSNETKTKRETTVSTPGGTTKVTETKEIEKSGDQPPAAPR